MDTNDVIKTMNDLTETSGDGEQGFRTCAQGVTSPNLKTLFEVAVVFVEIGNSFVSQGGHAVNMPHATWFCLEAAAPAVTIH